MEIYVQTNAHIIVQWITTTNDVTMNVKIWIQYLSGLPKLIRGFLDPFYKKVYSSCRIMNSHIA